MLFCYCRTQNLTSIKGGKERITILFFLDSLTTYSKNVYIYIQVLYMLYGFLPSAFIFTAYSLRAPADPAARHFFFFVISPSLRKKRDIVLFLEGNNESLLGAVCRVALYRQC